MARDDLINQPGFKTLLVITDGRDNQFANDSVWNKDEAIDPDRPPGELRRHGHRDQRGRLQGREPGTGAGPAAVPGHRDPPPARPVLHGHAGRGPGRHARAGPEEAAAELGRGDGQRPGPGDAGGGAADLDGRDGGSLAPLRPRAGRLQAGARRRRPPGEERRVQPGRPAAREARRDEPGGRRRAGRLLERGLRLEARRRGQGLAARRAPEPAPSRRRPPDARDAGEAVRPAGDQLAGDPAPRGLVRAPPLARDPGPHRPAVEQSVRLPGARLELRRPLVAGGPRGLVAVPAEAPRLVESRPGAAPRRDPGPRPRLRDRLVRGDPARPGGWRRRPRRGRGRRGPPRRDPRRGPRDEALPGRPAGTRPRRGRLGPAEGPQPDRPRAPLLHRGRQVHGTLLARHDRRGEVVADRPEPGLAGRLQGQGRTEGLHAGLPGPAPARCAGRPPARDPGTAPAAFGPPPCPGGSIRLPLHSARRPAPGGARSGGDPRLRRVDGRSRKAGGPRLAIFPHVADGTTAPHDRSLSTPDPPTLARRAGVPGAAGVGSSRSSPQVRPRGRGPGAGRHARRDDLLAEAGPAADPGPALGERLRVLPDPSAPPGEDGPPGTGAGPLFLQDDRQLRRLPGPRRPDGATGGLARPRGRRVGGGLCLRLRTGPRRCGALPLAGGRRPG